VSQFAIVDAPSLNGVTEGILDVDLWSTYTNFEEMALVNEDLEIIPAALSEYLSTEGRLESRSVTG
jgi:hypothetical protein